MEQLKYPNLNTVGYKYWCLKYATNVYGIPGVYGYATLAWQNTKYKHTDALPNVSVPVWYSWSGTVDGVYRDWGHVGVYVPGKGVYSSPLSKASGYEVYVNPQALANAIGGRYVGWSEDLNNVRVVQPTGGSMAENINDDTARQIGWHYLGRNGFDGKPNALQAPQSDLQGKPLTNTQLSAFFLSAEARDWRDSRIHKVYGERDALRTANTNLNAQVTQLTKAVADKQKVIDTQSAQIIGLNQTVNDKQAIIDTQTNQIAQLTKENTELKAQLATCGNGDDTEWLNKAGVALRWLIERLGIRK